MQLASRVSEPLGKLKLFAASPQAAEASVNEFVEVWRDLGRRLVQQQLQAQLETAEADYTGSRQRRSKRYHTPLGTVELTRRVYGSQGGECLGEQALGLPADGWFSQVQELGCALGVGSEFANANRLLERWSGVSVSEHTLANHVEALGSELGALVSGHERGRGGLSRGVEPECNGHPAPRTSGVLHRCRWHSHADARRWYL
jgi:hypothetical protein